MKLLNFNEWFFCILFFSPILWKIHKIDINILGAHFNVPSLMPILFIFSIIYVFKTKKIDKSVFNGTLLLFLLLLIHSLISLINENCKGSELKMLFSIVIISFYTFLSLEVVRKINLDIVLDKVSKIAFLIIIILIFSIFIEYLNPNFFPDKKHYQDANQYSGFEIEPSYFATSFFILLFSIYKPSLYIKLFLFIALLIVLKFTFTFTFLFCLSVYFLYLFKNFFYKYWYLFLSFVIFGLIFFQSILKLVYENNLYIYYRLTAITSIFDNKFLQPGFGFLRQGIKDSFLSLHISDGFGSGMNRMGCFGRAYDLSLSNLSYFTKDIETGTTLLIKSFYEFGIFVFLLLFIFLLSIRYKLSNYDTSIKTYFIGLICIFFISILIRSNSYFDFLSLILIFTVIYKYPFNVKNIQ